MTTLFSRQLRGIFCLLGFLFTFQSFLIHSVRAESKARPVLTVHGESHERPKCLVARERLIREAKEKRIYFFSENLFTSASSKSVRLAKMEEVYNTDSLDGVLGLETPESLNVGVYYYYSVMIRSKLENASRLQKFKSPPRDSELNVQRLEAVSLAVIGISQYIAFLSQQYGEEKLPAEIHALKQEVVELYRLPAEAFEARALETVYPKFLQLKTEIDLLRDQISKKLRLPEVTPAEMATGDSPLFPGTEDFKIASEEYRNTIVWRNHVMLKNLVSFLNRKRSDSQRPVEIVLGAAHVRHFVMALKEQYPELSKRYEIREDFSCIID
jgi:hypothetical protein